MYILILIIVWICIGQYSGITLVYKNLSDYPMWIVVPICIIFGPLSWIYYKIKEIESVL